MQPTVVGGFVEPPVGQVIFLSWPGAQPGLPGLPTIRVVLGQVHWQDFEQVVVPVHVEALAALTAARTRARVLKCIIDYVLGGVVGKL